MLGWCGFSGQLRGPRGSVGQLGQAGEARVSRQASSAGSVGWTDQANMAFTFLSHFLYSFPFHILLD